MDLDLLYEKMKGEEDHVRFDSEGYLHAPFIDAVDIGPMSENYAYIVTQGQAGSQSRLSRDAIDTLLEDVRFKDGFTRVVYMMRAINAQFVDMRAIAVDPAEQIDRELAQSIE